jgi:hypothetical protein
MTTCTCQHPQSSHWHDLGHCQSAGCPCQRFSAAQPEWTYSGDAWICRDGKRLVALRFKTEPHIAELLAALNRPDGKDTERLGILAEAWELFEVDGETLSRVSISLPPATSLREALDIVLRVERNDEISGSVEMTSNQQIRKNDAILQLAAPATAPVPATCTLCGKPLDDGLCSDCVERPPVPEGKTSDELHAEFLQLKEQAQQDIDDLNAGRPTPTLLGFLRYLVNRKRGDEPCRTTRDETTNVQSTTGTATGFHVQNVPSDGAPKSDPSAAPATSDETFDHVAFYRRRIETAPATPDPAGPTPRTKAHVAQMVEAGHGAVCNPAFCEKLEHEIARLLEHNKIIKNEATSEVKIADELGFSGPDDGTPCYFLAEFVRQLLVERDSLRADVDRLTKERDEASAHASKSLDALGERDKHCFGLQNTLNQITDALLSAETERDALRTDLAAYSLTPQQVADWRDARDRVFAERNAARDELSDLKSWKERQDKATDRHRSEISEREPGWEFGSFGDMFAHFLERYDALRTERNQLAEQLALGTPTITEDGKRKELRDVVIERDAERGVVANLHAILKAKDDALRSGLRRFTNHQHLISGRPCVKCEALDQMRAALALSAEVGS